MALPQRISDIITLSPYTFDEMRQILAQRATAAFKSGVVSMEVLDTITELAYHRQDLRYGLDLLYRAGCAADQSHITQLSERFIRQVIM